MTLGCTRNEVDSEELAGRLAAEGWLLVDDAADADVAVVNTCGFVEQAKKDSIDALLEASDLKDEWPHPGRRGRRLPGRAVRRAARRPAARGRRGARVRLLRRHVQPPARDPGRARARLAHAVRPAPAAAAVARRTPAGRRLGGAARPRRAVASDTPGAVGASGVLESRAPESVTIEGPVPASGPRVIRARLDGRPWAPLKIASGCDRRCAFCAIPMFRGAFVSRRPSDVLAEARWLGERGVKELFLVSENSTSYGKDLGDLRLLETLLPELAAVPGIERVRVSYLQPAEIRPGLLDAMASTPGVVPYFDISFQHASSPLLRRMRRFGGREAFLDLLDQRARQRAPQAGIRSPTSSSGSPARPRQDLAELEAFLVAARLDVVGVFGYSDEDGTEAEALRRQAARRTSWPSASRSIGALVEELTASGPRSASARPSRCSWRTVDATTDGELEVSGRAAHQGPDVDGVDPPAVPAAWPAPRVGDLVTAAVVGTEGIDLVAEPADDRRWPGARPAGPGEQPASPVPASRRRPAPGTSPTP